VPRLARLDAFLLRLGRALRDGTVAVSAYAIDRALDELGWAREDILAQLADLRKEDFLRREVSDRGDGVLIWVFRPELEGLALWIRIREHGGFFVISFHEA
jgi:hypothetical protein